MGGGGHLWGSGEGVRGPVLDTRDVYHLELVS